MKKFILFLVLILSGINVFSQTDATPESMFNVDPNRKVSGNENQYSGYSVNSNIPGTLLQQYNKSVDQGNDAQKNLFNKDIEKYLSKPVINNSWDPGIEITSGNIPPFNTDWYNTDILVSNTDVANFGGYRQLDLKQGEDGWMYLAVNRRNIAGLNGYITVFSSSNGGVNWATVANISSITGYFGSISMLVESRNNSIADSTRILIYANLSANSNLNDAYLICSSFRRNGSASYFTTVSTPAAGNRFVYPSACSDGMFWQNETYMHSVVREETNAGVFVKLHHFRSIDWGVNHTSGTISSFFDDKFPVCAFSNESGSDSIYIAVERVVDANEHEIRLFATPEIPSNNWSVRYITDAAPGTVYERPSITIQQRYFSLPQKILVTSTKNDRAVYHYSTDGGAAWNIDFSLGLSTQSVDFTSCNSDSSDTGSKDFIAAFVDLNGDSITVRHGILGSMGTPQYKRNTNNSTSTLAPTCAVFKEGSNKFSSFSYSGVGPTGVYYNMESLVTGITPLSNEIPKTFSLEQNYPNPFNPVTNIKFAVVKSGIVTLKVYDISGREVAVLVNEELNAGSYNFDFNAAQISSGIYFYRLTSINYTDTKKMVLIK